MRSYSKDRDRGTDFTPEKVYGMKRILAPLNRVDEVLTTWMARSGIVFEDQPGLRFCLVRCSKVLS